MTLSDSNDILESSASGPNEHYCQLYADELDREAEWLTRGAAPKADSIETLVGRSGNKPNALLELGCGTGAVISECQRRNIASRYLGIDYSSDALGYLREHYPGIETLQADISSPGFSCPGSFDVVVLSHVLEHMLDPAALLTRIRDSIDFNSLVIEVPLEDLFLSRAKALVRDRSKNGAGHVQFFTARSFERLVTSAGLQIRQRRTYSPVLDPDTLRLIADSNGFSHAHYLAKTLSSRYFPMTLGFVWTRLCYAHHAILCGK